MTIYGSRDPRPIDVLRVGTADDLEGQPPDASHRKPLAEYVAVAARGDDRVQLYHRSQLRADGGAAEIAAAVETLPGPLSRDDFATMPPGSPVEFAWQVVDDGSREWIPARIASRYLRPQPPARTSEEPEWLVVVAVDRDPGRPRVELSWVGSRRLLRHARVTAVAPSCEVTESSLTDQHVKTLSMLGEVSLDDAVVAIGLRSSQRGDSVRAARARVAAAWNRYQVRRPARKGEP